MLRQELDTLLTRFTKTLFYLLILIVPFVFTWVNEELFEFPKMLVVYGITLSIVATWVARMIIRQQLIWRQTFLDLPHLFFGLSQLTSTIFSLDPHTSWFGYYTRFHGGLLSTLTYLSLYHAFVSSFTRKDVTRLLLVLTIALFGISLYAFPEHFGVSPSCILIEGKATASCWVQDVQTRVFGTLGQPNWLAAYLVMLIPLTVATTISFLPTTKQSWSFQSILGIVTAILGFLVLLFTRSRSGFLGFIFGLSVAGVLLASKFGARGKAAAPAANSSHSQLLILALFSAAYLLSAAWFGTPFTPGLENNLSAKLKPSTESVQTEPKPTPTIDRLEVGGTDSGEIRKIVWTGAIKVWQRYPIFGSGVETFAYSYYLDRPTEHNLVSEWDFLYNKAHNELLNILATTGAVGLLSYLVMISTPLLAAGWFILKKPTSVSENSLYIICGIVAGLCGLHLSNFFGFSTVPVGVLMVLFHGLLFLVLPSQKTKSAAESMNNDKDEVATSHWVGICVVTLLVIFGIVILYRTWIADRYFATGKALATQTSLTQGVSSLEKAVELSPNEALYYDSLSYYYAQLAVALANENQATAAAQVVAAAITTSQQALNLNPAHTILYKGQVRTYLVLANLDERYLQLAAETLQTTIKLAPSDAKLWYQLGLVQQSLGQLSEAEQALQTTVQLKPNYEQAYLALTEIQLSLGKLEEAQQSLIYILTNLAPDNELAQQQLEAVKTFLATTSAQPIDPK